MQETLAFINDKWGSIAEYLDEIGFSFKEQRKLASVLARKLKVLYRSISSISSLIR